MEGVNTLRASFSRLPRRHFNYQPFQIISSNGCKAKLLEQCKKAYKSETLSLRELASLLGTLNWASYSVEYDPGHYRNLQSVYTLQTKLALGDLSTVVTFSSEAKSD
ncbi:hypothetical protein OUZ56_029458 [Daphnia magna]|uniref:Uncharacterized protein n=1 Tax=Daphnia magna TaxID=35525 RepID=A0ABR0B6W9_9CRUS|nr:hypothetical protein OUZ56_029458 [Daphnia magna]